MPKKRTTPAPVTREDAELGTLTWMPEFESWEFEVGRVGGRAVTGVLVPNPKFDPFSKRELSRIRKTVAWVKANDLAIREHIANEMWDWWFSECSTSAERKRVRKPEQFRDRLRLEVIRFDSADTDGLVVYADNGLLDHYGINISVTPTGRFTRGPEMG